MDDLLLFMYLVFLFFETILLLFYNVSNFLSFIFSLFLFFKKENKKTDFKSERIYFYYWIFNAFRTISGCSLMYFLIKLTDLLLKNIDFSTPTITKENEFAFLFLLLLISEFWRSTILKIDFYNFCRKYFKISKIWNKTKKDREKKKTKVGIE